MKDKKSNKKQRVESVAATAVTATQLSSPLSSSFDDIIAYGNALKAKYNTSRPYTHTVIDELCSVDRMKIIHSEITSNLTADFKETDLFKVFQTGELGNINSATNTTMPHLLALRDAIYSKSFRDFIGNVTGCHDITDRVDCSINAYSTGCHLLCHDDVIGTRRVSYIIYLTDPDDEWLAADGGALELYPLVEDHVVDRGVEHGGRQGIPTAIPTTTILPTFNTMALFAVQPGRSYHSVQEVVSPNKPRISISGWFHGPTPPVGSDLASLKQIMSKGDDNPIYSDYATVIDYESESLWESDKRMLSEYVNATYLTDAAIKKINKQFCRDSSVQLQDFLVSSISSKIQRDTQDDDRRCQLGNKNLLVDYTVGAVDGWDVVGPPHKRRHLLYNSSSSGASSSICGTQLNNISVELLQSDEFARYLYRLCSLKTTSHRKEIRRFRPGVDYTVAHYGCLTVIPKLDATLCFVSEEHCHVTAATADGEEDEDEDDVGPWESGDVGGFECYIEVEDDTNGDVEAAEVYKSTDNSNISSTDKQPEESLLSVSPGGNVMSLVMRDAGIMRFIKYVSAAAPGSRWDISMEYNIQQEDDDVDSDGDDNSDDVEGSDGDEGRF